MFDGSFSTFEAIKKTDAVTIVAVTNNTIIINDEEQPNRPSFVALPGGISDGEGLVLDNAKRELLEETGYQGDIWDEWFISDILGSVKIEWNNHFFIAKNCKKITEQKLDAGEKIKTNYLSFEEFLELRQNPNFRNKDLIPILEKASINEVEKQKLKTLLGITT